jgi:hypothetical protein
MSDVDFLEISQEEEMELVTQVKKLEDTNNLLSSYNNGFHSYYTLYRHLGTGVTFYWQNTINALAIGT